MSPFLSGYKYVKHNSRRHGFLSSFQVLPSGSGPDRLTTLNNLFEEVDPITASSIGIDPTEYLTDVQAITATLTINVSRAS